jgi:hypothetical protein
MLRRTLALEAKKRHGFSGLKLGFKGVDFFGSVASQEEPG